jgi:hypothetical protein
MKALTRLLFLAFAVIGLLAPARSMAQVTNVVFSEDFSGPLNTNKLAVGTISLEGGIGNIKPTVANGVVEFTGTVSQQWWPGGSLQVVPTFPANAETNVVVSVDRVQEIGGGTTVTDTAHRSALWVMDTTKTYFVLFAYNTENSWEYNFKIGSTSDVATGSGTAIAAFNDVNGPFLDNLLHQMKAVVNGQTAKLYLDDTFGVEVPFPFSPVVFAIGSLARANADVADTIFDNLMVETVGLEAFSPTTLLLSSGQTLSNVVVRIPKGANASKAAHVTVTSDTPIIAIPVGAVNGALSLTFPAGGTNVLPLAVTSVGPSGGAFLSLTNDINMGTANTLSVVVTPKAGVVLTDDFSGASIDKSKWQVSTNGFEAGDSDNFTVTQANGTLDISGDVDVAQYWAGASLVTQSNYVATPQLSLSVEVDRLYVSTNSSSGTPNTATRTGIFLSSGVRPPNATGGPYVFFGQDAGETGWEVNVNPGNPIGSGTAQSQFSSLNDTNSHHLQLLADGSQVEAFLDGKAGGKFPFKVAAGIHFEIGAYGRALNDSAVGVFDNAKIQYVLPPIDAATTSSAQAPTSIETMLGVDTNTVLVTVPLLITSPLGVTITSANPNVAVPQGAVNGALTLQFAPGAANTQTFSVKTVGAGSTTFNLTNNQALAMGTPQVGVTVINPLSPIFSDNFNFGTVDTNKNWKFDTTALDTTTPGDITADSSITVTNGVLEMAITANTANWPGMDLITKSNYAATATSPVTFEVDRVKLGYTLVTGTSALERTGVWVFDATGANYVFFDEYVVHNTGTVGGWQYNVVTDQPTSATPLPLPAVGTVIPAFTAPAFNDQGNHHMKVEANSSTVTLWLDGVYGASVPFPFGTGLTFGIGTYVAAATDIVDGFFDNVVISGAGGVAPTLGKLTATQANGQVVIAWSGAGTLQSTAALPGGWTDVSPPPTGNSYSIPVSGLKQQQYYRLRQSGGVVAPTCSTASPDSVWVNSPMADQTGTFTAEFDATPSQVPIDSVMALSAGAGTAFTSFACLARFYQGDTTTTPPAAPRIDARNGSAYAADNVIPYSANVTYHFRMAVNIPAHTYSTYVTPAGGTELTVGANYAFRTEQNTVTHLDHWGVIVDTATATGTNTVCNFQIP